MKNKKSREPVTTCGKQKRGTEKAAVIPSLHNISNRLKKLVTIWGCEVISAQKKLGKICLAAQRAIENNDSNKDGCGIKHSFKLVNYL